MASSTNRRLVSYKHGARSSYATNTLQRTEWLHSFCQARPVNVWVSIAATDHKSCDAVFVDLSTLDERFTVLRSGEAQDGYSL